ncbi:MAG: hypothetical protein COU35_01890 [Candidatus Magasanikbacteria bacterium CG10_big_fil_rev_8_21_14_0_10_47_10]|uniref:Glycosyl transferase family 1 domain-containing protein n=1 Tax=Candidatus Magasanikbacteria bacterium CG10_big_fil_rev_8_21_14_0_10_47_10 TaxID=1974652 RepID=A0A2H0TT08_9BACT|nr:MAG: hypothetical protein COU35_01890 [Candidatus Magasanikbacteria bacterium CG10_big_fil_rev_8_21_14_0_10_47_10]
MIIGIDVRVLMSRSWTGVGEYTHGLLHALFRVGTDHEFYLFSSGSKKNQARVRQLWSLPNVRYVHTRVPNRILNPLLLLFCIKVDALVAWRLPAGKKINTFISPNIHFGRVSNKAKHIQIIHDLSFELYPEFLSLKRRLWHWLLLPKRVCQHAAHIVTPSNNTKRDVTMRYTISPEKVTCVYPGIDVPQPISDALSDSPYILYLGTVEPRKNVDAVVDGFLQSHLSAQGVRLVLAGSNGWKSRALFKKIAQHPEIEYRNYISTKEKRRLLAGATALVFPSFYEGFGFPPLEAMAAGTPVIAANRSSMPEVCGDAAWYVDPYSISGIANAMRIFANDLAIRDKYIHKGYTWVRQFEWGIAAKDILQLIRSL